MLYSIYGHAAVDTSKHLASLLATAEERPVVPLQKKKAA